MWETLGPLNLKQFHDDIPIMFTDSIVSQNLLPCKVDNINAAFIGQSNDDTPNGFVRVIYKTGEIYEGTVIKGLK